MRCDHSGLKGTALTNLLWRGTQAALAVVLWQAITEAFAAITSRDAQGWFTHAGYRVPSN